MVWFGASWGAPVCDPEKHVETPLGAACGFCENPVQKGEYGVVLPFAGAAKDDPPWLPYHHRCFMKSLGLDEYRRDTLPAPAPLQVHILWHGLPMCGFTTEIPEDWPEGHKWVSRLEREDATCENCLIKTPVEL